MTTEQKLREAAENAVGCLHAAETEGLQQALAETQDEHLKDLVQRRLLYAFEPLRAALAQPPAPEQQAPQSMTREQEEDKRFFDRLVASPSAPEAAKPLFADLIAATPGAAEELKAVDAQADEVIRQYEDRQAEAAKPEPETERAALVNSPLSLLDDQTLGLEEDQEDIIKEAGALLAADSKAAGEPTGLVRCEFDDGCEFCSNPEGGIFTRLIHNPEDVTEAEFYICGKCVHEAIGRYPRPQQQAKPLTVRLTSFPESNGKRNWTALLVRKEPWNGLRGNAGGITLAHGEFWNRVAYEAERARFLIGERDTEPYIMDYGLDIKTPDEWTGERAHGIGKDQA